MSAAPQGEMHVASSAIALDVIGPVRRMARWVLFVMALVSIPLWMMMGGIWAEALVIAVVAVLVLQLARRIHRRGPGPGSVRLEGDSLVIAVEGGRRGRRTIPAARIASGYRTEAGVELRTRALPPPQRLGVHAGKPGLRRCAWRRARPDPTTCPCTSPSTVPAPSAARSRSSSPARVTR